MIENNACLHSKLGEWSEDLELLRQNRLLEESAFLRFARDRGVSLSGFIRGEPGEFNKRGWLSSDREDQDGTLFFHPFRSYSLQRILQHVKQKEFVELRSSVPESPEWDIRRAEARASWNKMTDLAILLEPLYWPEISGRQTLHPSLNENEYDTKLSSYRERVFDLLKRLDPSHWKALHEDLRRYACQVDDNGDLYLLLRASTWQIRERLKGPISAALWIRHMGEVVRRGFEQVNAERWKEEDWAFGAWVGRGRTLLYGSERPLDEVHATRSRIALRFGLFTGSVVKWYVEGDTEYYAIQSVLKPEVAGIELVNLMGNIALERANIALKLRDALDKDCALRRFSMISFDRDVVENVKAIRRHVDAGRVVGFIAAHDPDFEFANFTLAELIEIAADLDEQRGASGEALRCGNWSGIRSARGFEERYAKISQRSSVLKGQGWGRAMADYADKHPLRSDNENERPFWQEIRAALQCMTANYDFQRDRFKFDRQTFALVERRGEE